MCSGVHDCVDIQSKRTVQIKKKIPKVENSFCSLVKDTEFESSEEKICEILHNIPKQTFKAYLKLYSLLARDVKESLK